MKRILVPVDGSNTSLRAVRHVVALARDGASVNIVLLHVLPATLQTRSRSRKRAQQLADLTATDRATASAQALLERARLPFRRHVRFGAPADAILDVAKRERCDQIVMGTRGLGAIAGLVLGSVAMKVLQLATVPVTLVK
jgi:nucleotide-binding universal stress UspA family protein